MARASTTVPRTVADLGEFGLIDRIRAQLPAGPDRRIVVPIGDDVAAFRPAPGKVQLATCDVQVEGRHFDRRRISAQELGRRSAAINLSDIAAMGGRPTFALVSLALPETTPLDWVDHLYLGINEELGRFEAAVVGGNVSGSRRETVIDLTLLGEVEEERVLTRRGARPGDAVLVTGSLGASLIGRLALEQGLDRRDDAIGRVVQRHVTPTPRVHEGQAIAETRLATAMIDVSDGLAGDLGHVCERSGVGVEVVAAQVPVDDATLKVAALLGEDALEAALHGGEDYELLVTCPQAQSAALARLIGERTSTAVTEIGRVVVEPGMTLVLTDGGRRPLEPRGWDHFARRGTP